MSILRNNVKTLARRAGLGLVFAIIMMVNVRVGVTETPGVVQLNLAGVSTAYAKPPYCQTALTQCLDTCSHEAGILVLACDTGCNIGYLTCGN